MSVDNGFNFVDKVPKRVEILAKNEADIAYLAMGISVNMIPKKVVNPNNNDFNRIVDNLDIKGILKKKMIGFLIKKSSSGLADPIDNTIYDINGSNYETGIYGIKWRVLEGVSDISLHEFGHSWLFQNGNLNLIQYDKKLKVFENNPELVEKDKIETAICVKVVSEGVAMYIAKRSNDYIRNTMVKAVEESIPGGVKERERCAEIYSFYYDKKNNPDTIEEDMALIKDVIKTFKYGQIGKIINAEFYNEFQHEIVYRLGYNLVSMEVDKKMNEGMTESEALLYFAQNPPFTFEDMTRRLRVER